MPSLLVVPNPAQPSTVVDVQGSGFVNLKTRLTLNGMGELTNIFRPRRDGGFSVGISLAASPLSQVLLADQQQPDGTWKQVAAVAINAQLPLPVPPASLAYTSSVGAGATLKGKVKWLVTVTKGTPTKIEFYIDSVLAWTEKYAPYQFNGDPDGVLDTGLLSVGSHGLTVVGYDVAGAHTPAGGTVVIDRDPVPVPVPVPVPTPTPTPTPVPGQLPPIPAGLASGAITLQQAINAAGANAVFGVPPRVFPETITPMVGQRLVTLGAIIDGGSSRQYGILYTQQGVTTDGFEVRNHKTPLQDGAIRVRAGNAKVLHAHAHHNTGPGISIGSQTALVEDSEFDRNLQQGYHGSHSGQVTYRRCHIHHNNEMVNGTPTGPRARSVSARPGWYWPVDPFWEAGAGKITNSLAILFEDCEVHDNGGVGLWSDINGNDWNIRRCKIYRNDLSGIMFEISTGSVIEENRVWHNGEYDHRGWGWPANILVSSAANVKVRKNVVAHGLAGISVITQNRSDKPANSGGLIEITDNVVCMPNAYANKGVAWYDDWAHGFPGKIDSGNKIYSGQSTERDAVLAAAGIPMI